MTGKVFFGVFLVVVIAVAVFNREFLTYISQPSEPTDIVDRQKSNVTATDGSLQVNEANQVKMEASFSRMYSTDETMQRMRFSDLRFSLFEDSGSITGNAITAEYNQTEQTMILYDRPEVTVNDSQKIMVKANTITILSNPREIRLTDDIEIIAPDYTAYADSTTIVY